MVNRNALRKGLVYMKRFFAVTLVLVLCLGVLPIAMAEVETISFRGIEWGTPATELESKLSEVKLYSWDDVDSPKSVANFLFDGDDIYYDGEVNCRNYARPSSLKDLKVAGYAVEELYVYCAYVPGADGLLTGDLKDTAFIEAYYELDTKDPDLAYDDLLDKLTGLYGEVFYSNTRSPYISYTYNVWKAADDSMVCLEKRIYPSSGTDIYVKYAAGNADELMSSAYKALVLQETKDAASNTDGL